MSKIKLIIYDFDGTIADTYPQNLITEQILARKYGYKKLIFSPKLREKTFLEILRNEISLKPIQIPLFFFRFQNELPKHMQKSKLFPQIFDLITSQKNKYILGIISTNISRDAKTNIKILLEKNKINNFAFIENPSFLIGKANTIRNKLKELNLNPNEAIFIGDETKDIIAAKKAKVKSIAVSWGFHKEEILKKQNPFFIAKTPKDIEKILNKLENSKNS